MTRIRLTNHLIRKALPRKKAYALSDSALPGLIVVINPSGKKSFFLRVQRFKKKIGLFPYDDIATARRKGLLCYGEHWDEIELRKRKIS